MGNVKKKVSFHLFSVRQGKDWLTFQSKSDPFDDIEKEDKRFLRRLEKAGVKIPTEGLTVIFVRVTNGQANNDSDSGKITFDGKIEWRV